MNGLTSRWNTSTCEPVLHSSSFAFYFVRLLFLTADLLSSIAPIIGITTLRYGNGLSLERRMSMDIIPTYPLAFTIFISCVLST